MAPYDKAPGTGARNGQLAGRGAGSGALAVGVLFAVLITVCDLVVSYNGIYAFARYGGHGDGAVAHVFPLTHALLLLMAFGVSYVVRQDHPRDRVWVDALILFLILVAGTAMALDRLGFLESVHQGVADVIVAVAPLAALLIAFLLWMAVRSHMRRARRSAVPRGLPPTDRATVLRGRAEEEPEWPREPAPGHGGPEPEPVPGAAPPEPDAERVPAPVRPGPEPRGRPQEDEPDTGSHETGDHGHGPPQTEVSTPALPRRPQTADNPIKRAAERPPAVSPTARPVGPEAERPVDDSGPEPSDEGFVHEPLPGDPVSDEGEVPTAAPSAVEPAGEEPIEEERVLWEPPADRHGPPADYEPPVWTPPEAPPAPVATPVAERAPVWEAPEGVPDGPSEAFPALNHDTGPSVRAAFGIPPADPDGPVTEPEPVDTFEEDAEPVPEAEPLPAEPSPGDGPVPPAGGRPPLEKRPMALKPRRGPIDLTPVPPSRRMRSGPLPPDGDEL
ncbi:hypothetical protein [Nocardiopsis sp. CNT312]|uniref:hypothetical protein n=1 Tax=Nocardiopsis sp. CNT312 TaxID=1137268 RepID=UPI00048DF4E9|nr:hypothetical protein [Nocardiopsis sp. CNT312]